MENQKPRTYVGKGVKVGKFDLINISICIDDVESYVYEYNGKRYAKLVVGGLRETDQYGKTHSVWINDYKPTENQTTAPKQQAVSQSRTPDLPF